MSLCFRCGEFPVKKDCVLAHSGVSRGRLQQPSSSRECASLARSAFLFNREVPSNFPVEQKIPRRYSRTHRELSDFYFSAQSFFISFTITAFCACRRFSASLKISSACSSKTSSVISCPRYAGRQCWTIAPAFAAARSCLLIW